MSLLYTNREGAESVDTAAVYKMKPVLEIPLQEHLQTQQH